MSDWCAVYKYFVVCWQLCHLSVISMEHKISVLFTKLHKYNDVHEDGIWLDTEDVDCSYASVDKELATHDTSSINELFDECEGSSGSKENRKMFMTWNES